MAGIGKAIKGLGLLAKKYKKGVAKKASIQIGKGVVDRNVKSKEVFKTIQGLRKKPKPSKLKKIAIKTAPIGAAAAAGEAYGRHREKSKGKK